MTELMIEDARAEQHHRLAQQENRPLDLEGEVDSAILAQRAECL